MDTTAIPSHGLRARTTRVVGRMIGTAALLALMTSDALAQLPAPPPVGTDLRVDADFPGLYSSVKPAVTGTDDDGIHITWSDYRNPSWDIYYRRLEAFGTGTAQAEIQISAGVVGNDSRPAIATDGVDDIYVAWHNFTGNVVETVQFARSTDGGFTWSVPVALNLPAGFVSEPQICADGSGRVYVAWSEFDGLQDQIYMVLSVNSGATFSAPVRVNAIATGHSEHPRLACDNAGTLHITYFDRRFDNHDVFYRRYVVGAGFGPDRLIETSPNQASSLAIAADHVGGSGLVVATWINFGFDVNNALVTCLESNWSTDAGVNWQPAEVAVSGICAAPTITPVFLDGDLTAAWDAGTTTASVHAAYGRIEIPDGLSPTAALIHHTAFTWDGVTAAWGTETQLSTGGAPYPNKGQVFPLPRTQIMTDPVGGRFVFASWMQTESGFETYFDIKTAWSKDWGASWSAPTRLTSHANGSGTRSAFPRLWAASNRAVGVWDDRRMWTTDDELPPGSPYIPGEEMPIGSPDVYLNTITLQR